MIASLRFQQVLYFGTFLKFKVFLDKITFGGSSKINEIDCDLRQITKS